MQRYFSELKKDNMLILSKDDLYHIKTVMRMKEDYIEVVYNNQLHICKLDKDYNAVIEKIVVAKKEKNINIFYVYHFCKNKRCLSFYKKQQS